MRFLVDAQLPPALARWLEAKGHEAVHVGDLAMQAASDAVIGNRALESKSASVTKDEDFAQRKVLADNGPAHLVRGGAAGRFGGVGARRNADRGYMNQRPAGRHVRADEQPAAADLTLSDADAEALDRQGRKGRLSAKRQTLTADPSPRRRGEKGGACLDLPTPCG